MGAPVYRNFLDASGLWDEIAARLHHLDINDPVALTSASAHIRAEVNAAEVPHDIEGSILAAYEELGSSPVAVRASTTSANTPTESSAGVHETQTRISGNDELITSVRHCWSSLFTAPSIAYAAKHGRSVIASDIAVLVQLQIEPVKAGMMVTEDPVSGMTDRIVIEAALGLGEAIAGGSVLPDRYEIEKETNKMLTRQIRHKELVVEKVPDDGSTIRHIAKEDQDASVLNDLEIKLLAEMGRKAERYFDEQLSLE